MDEPTAALSGVEVERLFSVARSLRDERRGGAVHLAPLRRGVRAVPAHHRHARRRLGLHRPDRATLDRRPGRAPDGRPRGRPRCTPSRTTEPGEVLLEVRGLTSHGVFTDISFTVRARRDRRAGRAGRRRAQRGGPGGLRRRPLRQRRGHRSAARACRTGVAVGRDRGRPRAGARGPPPAGPGDGAVGRAQRDAGPALGAEPVRAAAPARRATRGRATGPSGCSVKADTPRRSGLDPVRRQPAEGRAGEVAGHRAAGADRRRADPRHRRRHQGRGAPPARPSWPPTASPY